MKNSYPILEIDTSKSFCLSHFQINEKEFIRVFGEETPDSEFDWHMDEYERSVLVVFADEGWKIQNDNDLPVALKTGDKLNIQKEFYHRLLKGSGRLVIYVVEKRY